MKSETYKPEKRTLFECLSIEDTKLTFKLKNKTSSMNYAKVNFIIKKRVFDFTILITEQTCFA